MNSAIIEVLCNLVISRSVKSENGHCLIYTGPFVTKANGTQYGKVNKRINGVDYQGYAHRYSKLHACGIVETPPLMTCSHLCHDGRCVNPDHIVIETVDMNNKRKTCKNRPEGCIGHVDTDGNSVSSCLTF